MQSQFDMVDSADYNLWTKPCKLSENLLELFVNNFCIVCLYKGKEIFFNIIKQMNYAVM